MFASEVIECLHELKKMIKSLITRACFQRGLGNLNVNKSNPPPPPRPKASIGEGKHSSEEAHRVLRGGATVDNCAKFELGDGWWALWSMQLTAWIAFELVVMVALRNTYVPRQAPIRKKGPYLDKASYSVLMGFIIVNECFSEWVNIGVTVKYFGIAQNVKLTFWAMSLLFLETKTTLKCWFCSAIAQC